MNTTRIKQTAKEPLLWVQRLLDIEEIEYTLDFHEVSQQDRLLLVLGEDDQDRRRLCEVVASKESCKESFLLLAAESYEKEYFKIQFTATFPFLVDEKAFVLLHRTLAYLNCRLALPGLILHEESRTIVFRYLLWTDRDAFDPSLILDLIGIIELMFVNYGESLEMLSEERIPFERFREEVEKSQPQLKKPMIFWA